MIRDIKPKATLETPEVFRFCVIRVRSVYTHSLRSYASGDPEAAHSFSTLFS